MRCVLSTALLFLVFLGASALPSCTYKTFRDPRDIVEALPADPPTLNPVLAGDETAFTVLSNIYESLLDMDFETLGPKPLLAKKWEISADHLTYTLWLREDVKWHDGKAFTADDVIFTFETINNPKVDAARYRNYFKDITKIEKLGPHVVRFVYAKPYFKALEMIGGMAIIPKHIFGNGEDFNTHPANRFPVGTGAYKFGGWKSNQKIWLSRFDGYWGEEPKIRDVVYKVVPEAMVRLGLLKKGALDIEKLTAIQWVRQTVGAAFEEQFNKYRYYLPNYSYIGWNSRKPFFSDRRVRIAMTMLINRKEILDKIMLGQGELISCGFYRFGENYDESIAPYPFDPKEAVRLLEEAGWIDHDGDGIRDKDGIPFRFTLVGSAGSTGARTIGILLREELMRVGIRMDVQQFEWATMLNMLANRNFDAALMAFSTTFHEDPYQLWHSSQASQGSNFAGFVNARADELIENGRTEFDPKKRAGLYRELHAILHYEEPVTFMFTIPTRLAVAKRFTDVKVYKRGLNSNEWNIGPGPRLVEW